MALLRRAANIVSWKKSVVNWTVDTPLQKVRDESCSNWCHLAGKTQQIHGKLFACMGNSAADKTIGEQCEMGSKNVNFGSVFGPQNFKSWG